MQCYHQLFDVIYFPTQLCRHDATAVSDNGFYSMERALSNIKEEHLEEANDLVKFANDRDRENRQLKLKCNELEKQLLELEDDLQSTEGRRTLATIDYIISPIILDNNLRLEVGLISERKVFRRNSQIIENTARLKIFRVSVVGWCVKCFMPNRFLF